MVAAPAGATTLPRRSGTTGVFARIRALPEHRVIDRLLRSRAWIWALGALLGGIVAMQVSLLKLNSGISRAVETTTTTPTTTEPVTPAPTPTQTTLPASATGGATAPQG
jgi:hypothetical protein